MKKIVALVLYAIRNKFFLRIGFLLYLHSAPIGEYVRKRNTARRRSGFTHISDCPEMPFLPLFFLLKTAI